MNRAIDVRFRGDQVVIYLEDGLELRVPLHRLPPLMHATQEQQNNWEFIAGGLCIYWPVVDEYIDIEDLLPEKKHK